VRVEVGGRERKAAGMEVGVEVKGGDGGATWWRRAKNCEIERKKGAIRSGLTG